MPSVEPYPSGCLWSKHYITHSVHHISHIVWPGAAWNASPAQSFPPALRWSKCFQGQTTAAGAWNGKNLQLEINRIQDLGFIRHFLYPFILNQPSYSAQNPQKSSRKISEMWKSQTTVEEQTPSASISIIHHFHHPDLLLQLWTSVDWLSRSLAWRSAESFRCQSESRQIQLKTLPCVFLLRGCYSTVTWWTCISCGETVKR